MSRGDQFNLHTRHTHISACHTSLTCLTMICHSSYWYFGHYSQSQTEIRPGLCNWTCRLKITLSKGRTSVCSQHTALHLRMEAYPASETLWIFATLKWTMYKMSVTTTISDCLLAWKSLTLGIQPFNQADVRPWQRARSQQPLFLNTGLNSPTHDKQANKLAGRCFARSLGRRHIVLC